MKNDNPDTFPEAEQTRWMETLADDVFLPTVRVQLNWRDVEAAVSQGAIVPQQAHALWANWAMPGSETRLGMDGHSSPRQSAPAQASTLESSWVERPMPEFERDKGMPSVLPFLLGIAVGAAGLWAYGYFMAS